MLIQFIGKEIHEIVINQSNTQNLKLLGENTCIVLYHISNMSTHVEAFWTRSMNNAKAHQSYAEIQHF